MKDRETYSLRMDLGVESETLVVIKSRLLWHTVVSLSSKFSLLKHFRARYSWLRIVYSLVIITRRPHIIFRFLSTSKAVYSLFFSKSHWITVVVYKFSITMAIMSKYRGAVSIAIIFEFFSVFDTLKATPFSLSFWK